MALSGGSNLLTFVNRDLIFRLRSIQLICQIFIPRDNASRIGFYFLAVFADRIVCFVAPKTLVAERFIWFTGDAKSLLLVVRELELDRSYQKAETSALLIEFSVYHAALFFGERKYYGLKVRWPRWFINRLHFTGMQLDATQWQEGCQNGFSDAAVLESSATAHC